MIPCAIEQCRVNIRVDVPQDSERNLADTGGLFQAGDEERQRFMMHLTSCLENNR